jgi:hypothetical protein
MRLQLFVKARHGFNGHGDEERRRSDGNEILKRLGRGIRMALSVDGKTRGVEKAC